MDTTGRRRTNKRWPEALKQEIVAASYAPGASVSTVARRYDVNANQVFSWRRRFGPPSETARPPAPQCRSQLVPVTISVDPTTTGPPSTASAPDDVIEIDVDDTYRIRIGSNFNCRALKRVLDVLRKR